MVVDAKRRRSSFMIYAKESLSVNSSVLIQCSLFTPPFAMSDFYPTWLYSLQIVFTNTAKFKAPKVTKKQNTNS